MNEEQGLSSQFTEQSVETTTSTTKQLSSISDLLSQSFMAYKSIFWKLIGMEFLPLLMGVVFFVLFIIYGISNFFLQGLAIVNIINMILCLSGLILIVVLIVVSYISKAGIYVLIRDYQKQLSIKRAFFVAKKSTWGFVVVGMSVALFIVLWSLLFIIPGLIMMIFYSMAPWAYFYEGFTGISALKRSKELVKGYFWALVVRYGVIIISFIIVVYLPFILIDSMAFAELWSVIGNIASFLLVPFVTIYSFDIFLELRKIKGESQIEKISKV